MHNNSDVEETGYDWVSVLDANGKGTEQQAKWSCQKSTFLGKTEVKSDISFLASVTVEGPYFFFTRAEL